ncbi:MAG: Arginine--tRNA ligase [Bacteroidota bacterium]|jgi:arginyl-tRNA synthetase
MIIRFDAELKQSVSEGLKELFGQSVAPGAIPLQETKREFEGDVTIVVFPYSKPAGLSPEEFGDKLGSYLLERTSFIERFNVVKGFLNLVIDNLFWKRFFSDVAGNTASLFDPTSNPHLPVRSRLMVEYSSPNTNKPLHLGHIRNNLLGYSVAEILKAAGNDVVKVNLVNDRGIHICKSMLAWKKFGNGETPESSGMKGDHLVGKYYVLYDKKYREQVDELVAGGRSKEDAEKQAPLQSEIQKMLRDWEAGDPDTISLWKTMNGWVYDGFAVTYDELGVDFDKTYYESETYLLGKKIVEEGLEKGVFFRKPDGSVWIDLTDAGLDQKVVLRADGTSVYITQDLGTAQLRFDEYPGLQRLVYVVGNEQDYHFKVLREIFRKMGRPWADGIFHLSYGMVDLPSGKMKSREGTVVDADDLIGEITREAENVTRELGKLDDFQSDEAKALFRTLGMGALKYFILKVDPKKRMLFNPAESIDLNGNTGPFIQYTHARIRSVLRKGENYSADPVLMEGHAMSEAEKKVVALLYAYPETLSAAAEQLSPALIAGYVYDLAKSFNHFYHDHVIVDESMPSATAFRLNLARVVADVLREGTRLLGITVPERM